MINREKFKNGISLYHGDCFDILPRLKKQADLILTDPPYGGIIKKDWDKIDINFHLCWIRLCANILKETGSFVSYCSIGEKSRSLIHIEKSIRKYLFFKDMIVWAKQRGRGNRKGFLFAREECLWAVKNDSKFYLNKNKLYSRKMYHESWQKRLKDKNPFKRYTNVITDIEEVSITRAKGKRKGENRKSLHVCEKPVDLHLRFILLFTQPGDLIIDPFAGSGSVGMACLKNDRKYIGIEKDKENFDMACRNLFPF